MADIAGFYGARFSATPPGVDESVWHCQGCNCGGGTHDREAVRKAIVSALPVDWDDYTTLVQVIPVPDESGIKTVWGRPERVAAAVIAALQPFLAVRVPEAGGPNELQA